MARPRKLLRTQQKKIDSDSQYKYFSELDKGFFVIDSSLRYVYVNKKGAQIAQKTQKELLGRKVTDFFLDAHALEFGQALKQVMKTRTARNFEAYYPRYKKWYESSVFPVEAGVGILSQDITNRLKAEEDLLRLASIVTSSDDAIVSKDLKSIVTSWNKGAEKMFGYKAQEIIGKSIRILIPAELQKQEDEILDILKKGKRIDHFETIRKTKDGRLLNVSLTISPLKNTHGEIIGASKIARDITDIKQTEENLRFLAEASSALSASLNYQQTLNKVASLAVPKIADWCSVEMLDAQIELKLVAVAHKDPEKVKWAKELRETNPPNMSSPTGLPNVLRTGKTEIYPFIDEELILRSTRNKKEIALIKKLQLTSAIISPILVNRKPIGGITFITTQSRRRYTKTDVAMAEELASRASLAIENARLYREMRRELNERKRLEKQKDEFIGVASHELKTPVTSIKSFAQILQYKFQKQGYNSEAELLGKLDSQIDKLTSLIGDLLDVTKIEAGQMLFNEEKIPVKDLVAEIVEEMQRTTEKHRIKIKGTVDKIIISDRERIGQVLINLISNAIKYSPYSKEIIVRTLIEKDMIQVCVLDFGVGITKDKQEKVFDRFFRVSGPGRETYPGLGLGLYISNEIIKRMGGKIWVKSIEGKGSTFCFSLPITNEKHKESYRSKEKIKKVIK